MNKLFGYSNKGGQDWFNIDAYSDKEIESINDPEGGNKINLPTAIPTPFARIDLAKTAFRNICKTNQLKAENKNGDVLASREDEKLVSYTLDLAEIIFNVDSLGDSIKFIVWDRKTAIEKLKKGSDANKRYADTLEMYLTQDAASYNFDMVDRFFLVEHNHKIIGCTSPVTLFFPTANDLSGAKMTLTKKDVTFSEPYKPLYKRDKDFQKYLWSIFLEYPILIDKMKDVYEYLKKSLDLLEMEDGNSYQELKNLPKTYYSDNYAELSSGVSDNDIIKVIGIPLRKRKKEDIKQLIEKSDFLIKSTKKIDGDIPLVLENNFSKAFKYVNDIWDYNTQVPYLDEETDLEKRWLPGVKIQYPYLTVSDFLEPYLIRMVYPINKEKYFDGNLKITSGKDTNGYLLPLKREFFKYFTVDDLLSNAASGKPKLEMEQGVSGSVKVTLKIPLTKAGEYINLSRTYHLTPEHELIIADEKGNYGVLVEQQVGITLFPWVKTKRKDIKAFYRVQLIDRNVGGLFGDSEYKLSFFDELESNSLKVKNEDAIESKKPRKRSFKESLGTSTQYYVLENEFDYIQMQYCNYPSINALIIPLWPSFRTSEDNYSFAIDFGTTNTHIEYKLKDKSLFAFDILPTENLVEPLFHPKTNYNFFGTSANDIRDLIDKEFVPQEIGSKNSSYSFPFRTVIAEGKNDDLKTKARYALADYNIPFKFQKEPIEHILELNTNLKWLKNETNNNHRVEAYLEQIIFLMRSKVLRNGGNLDKTKLIWFYPTSMEISRKNQLEAVIDKLHKKYFNNDSPIPICESLAPFYYYKSSNQLVGGGHTAVVSIDIGGGSTDVTVFKDHKPLLLTSFRFAANAVFGDGFGSIGTSLNGILEKYFPLIEESFSENNSPYIKSAYEEFKKGSISQDIITFLFSLENNPEVLNNNIFPFQKTLSKDENIKIIFLYFYTAIVYHVAKLIILKLDRSYLPSGIVFSGNGSKILDIITPSTKTLTEFSKHIMEGVFEMEYNGNHFQIKMERTFAKEVTCKGGLLANPEELAIDLKNIKMNLTCLESDGKESLLYNQLNNETLTKISNEVKTFNNYFLKLNTKMDFEEHFGISTESLEFFKSEVNKNILDYLSDGIRYKKGIDSIINEEKEIEETLFFYPIIGIISNTLKHLSATSTQQ